LDKAVPPSLSSSQKIGASRQICLRERKLQIRKYARRGVGGSLAGHARMLLHANFGGTFLLPKLSWKGQFGDFQTSVQAGRAGHARTGAFQRRRHDSCDTSILQQESKKEQRNVPE